ncbi:hypothetical protein CU097_007111 [Rhizopus azygosporus]|uniref:Uncharacterized protein n=1 Tax=Rhizopus azygosporus TaxID=86630 RepID=A0A367J6T6_RHIAZ|nr:hypothetical protein CU097_007111 [Rhizopus azygosporus]
MLGHKGVLQIAVIGPLPIKFTRVFNNNPVFFYEQSTLQDIDLLLFSNLKLNAAIMFSFGTLALKPYINTAGYPACMKTSTWIPFSVALKRKRKYNDEEKKNLLETDKRDDICNTKCTKCLSNLTLLIV